MKKNMIRKNLSMLVITSGLLLTVTLSVGAQSTRTTVESCSSLLPAGYVYELSIKGTIDRDNMQGLTGGSIKLSIAGTDESPVDDELGNQFGQCVYPLLK